MFNFYSGLRYFGAQNLFTWSTRINDHQLPIVSILDQESNKSNRGFHFIRFEEPEELQGKYFTEKFKDPETFSLTHISELFGEPGHDVPDISIPRNSVLGYSAHCYRIYKDIREQKSTKEELAYLKGKLGYIDIEDELEIIRCKEDMYYETYEDGLSTN